MRCFLAIDLPLEIREYLSNLKKELRMINAKFVEKENLHLTLKFLGEISQKDVEDLKKRLDHFKFKSFKAKLGKLGVFPSIKFMRILWVSLQPENLLKGLYKEIEKKVSDLHFFKKEDFNSHITLARIRSLIDKNELVDWINETKEYNKEVEITSFKLKKSILTAKGPIYEDILEFKLV